MCARRAGVMRVVVFMALAGAGCQHRDPLEKSAKAVTSGSSNASNFNGTAIAAGSSIWFSSVFKVNGLGSAPAHLYVTSQHIAFTANGVSYDLPVPDGIVTITPGSTTASTTFDSNGRWETSIPAQFSGNAFLSGLAWTVPVNLAGGIHPVTWYGTFTSDTTGLSVNWVWAAAVYTQLSASYNAFHVKPVDDSHLKSNSDHAGTPEAFKAYVVGGARGGGGSNYTGSLSGTVAVTPLMNNCALVTCTASDPCHVAGTCDPATGLCSNPSAPNGTLCTGTNKCNQTYSCQAGACIGSSPVTCTASDQCHSAGTCDPATGRCANPPAPRGTTCSDSNLCDLNPVCDGAGHCAGTPIVCVAVDQCHIAGICDPATGLCSSPNAPNGTACMGANKCNQTHTCQAGTCTDSDPVTCTASDQCHVAGVCDPATGQCTNPPAPRGTACTDADRCDLSPVCDGAGHCAGTPKTCTASDQCHVAGTCDPNSGQCSNPTATNGAPCTGTNKCNQAYACQSGTCTGSNPVTCTA